MKPTLTIMLAAIAFCSIGCVTIDPPAGFARVRDVYSFDLKAVSPAGDVITLSSHRNDDPNAGLTFWADAIEYQKTARDGMKLAARTDVESKNGVNGTLFCFETGSGTDRLLYYVAVYVTRPTIYVVEAAGPAERIELRSAEIEAAMKSLH